MATRDLTTEALAPLHDRDGFVCGVDSLDRYLKTQAGQDVKRRANAVFVLASLEQPAIILGYYTLCATSLLPGDVPATARKHIPRYPLVSATLIGRLAVSRAHQGEGYGSLLLADAVLRAYASAGTVGSCMIVADAIGERAAEFYRAFGFTRLPDSLRVVLPVWQLRGLVDPGS